MSEPIDPNHVGQHLEPSPTVCAWCDKCFEFRQAWTHVAGQLATMDSVVGRLKTLAGEKFSNGNDTLAQAYRLLATEFDKDRQDLSENLQRYIKASTNERRTNAAR